ncbi:flavin reductase family protein [Rhodococcus sp. NPDC057529]|uniref:flavin reductase family protein n=1 Tax=Rhodococcus sp. NPDC057529 TaxID=3346158 RepID=UPI00366A9933
MTLSLMTQPSDAQTLRKAFAHYPSGITALAATVDGKDHVLVSSSFMVGISLDPPLVSFAVQNSSRSWPVMRRAQQIGASVVAGHQESLCRQLAGNDRERRLAGVGIHRNDDAIFISEAAAWMSCSVYAEHPAGDHSIVVLEVTAVHTDPSIDPLIFHRSRFRPLG